MVTTQRFERYKINVFGGHICPAVSVRAVFSQSDRDRQFLQRELNRYYELYIDIQYIKLKPMESQIKCTISHSYNLTRALSFGMSVMKKQTVWSKWLVSKVLTKDRKLIFSKSSI